MGSAEERFAVVRSFLDKYRALTLEGILSYIPEREPRKYLYDLVSDYPNRGGKGFRPGLCLASCAAWGRDPRDALRSAVALELFHNAFLVHDDIEDESEDRRGRPTMHATQGIPIAVNVGDAMNVLSIRPLMDNLKSLGHRVTWMVLGEVEHMVRESVEGQAMELGWMRDNEIDLVPGDYLRMVLKKTCWYTCMHPIRIGAIIGTDGEIDPDRFNRFGFTGRRVPDSGRHPEPQWRARAIRQGDRRRHLGGKAHADPDSRPLHLRAAATRAPAPVPRKATQGARPKGRPMGLPPLRAMRQPDVQQELRPLPRRRRARRVQAKLRRRAR